MNDYENIDVEIIFGPEETSKSIEVKILDDTDKPVLEGEESFELQLSMAENAEIKDPKKTVIVIDDTDLDG